MTGVYNKNLKYTSSSISLVIFIFFVNNFIIIFDNKLAGTVIIGIIKIKLVLSLIYVLYTSSLSSFSSNIYFTNPIIKNFPNISKIFFSEYFITKTAKVCYLVIINTDKNDTIVTEQVGG